jgi:hypothetical protein
MSVTRIQITAIFAEYRLLHASCEIKDLCRSFIRAKKNLMKELLNEILLILDFLWA